MRSLVVGVVLALCACGSKTAAITVTKLADEPNTVLAFAADEAGLAWLSSENGDVVELKLLPLAGGQPVVIAKGLLARVALDREYVYWSDGEYVLRSKRTAPTPERIAAIGELAT